MYGYDILCWISKVPFEIPHKISYSYIERYVFLYNIEISRALRFKGSYAFLKRPPRRIILCMRQVNQRWRYNVTSSLTSSLIGWVHTQNDPWDLEDYNAAIFWGIPGPAFW